MFPYQEEKKENTVALVAGREGGNASHSSLVVGS